MKITRLIVDSKQPIEFQSQIKNAWPIARVMSLGENSGDVLAQVGDKTIVVECKESNDFIASITDKRLFAQSVGIQRITPWAFLLIGGDFRYDSNGYLTSTRRGGYGPTSWHRDHVDGALTRVQANGVIVRVAYKGWVDALRRIFEWVDTADNGSITRPEPVRLSPFDSVEQEAVNFLTFFDGIGVVQARNFLLWAGKRTLVEYLRLASTPFNGVNKPRGWTDNTINKIRHQLGLGRGQYIKVFERPEWKEELDESI